MKKKYAVTAAAIILLAGIFSVNTYMNRQSDTADQYGILTPVSDEVSMTENRDLVFIEDSAVPIGSEPDSSQSEEDPYIQQIIDLVNEERTKAGLDPLERSPEATLAAGVRAEEIFTTFDHVRPDGSRYRTALDQFTTDYSFCGENVAYGYRSPKAVMDGWMNSEGHKANILNEKFTKIGVGHYKGSNGYDYWSQMFTN